MEYVKIIAKEVDSLSTENQAEVLDFIELLQLKQSRADDTSKPRTVMEIEAFFRRFKVDASGFNFDRDEANAR